MVVSGFFETLPEFIARWYDEGTQIVVGFLRNNMHYTQTNKPVQGKIADIILQTPTERVYLYEQE